MKDYKPHLWGALFILTALLGFIPGIDHIEVMGLLCLVKLSEISVILVEIGSKEKGD